MCGACGPRRRTYLGGQGEGSPTCPDPDILWAPPGGGAVEARLSFLCQESSRHVLPHGAAASPQAVLGHSARECRPPTALPRGKNVPNRQ